MSLINMSKESGLNTENPWKQLQITFVMYLCAYACMRHCEAYNKKNYVYFYKLAIEENK